jgi:hypothetical protein
MPGERDYWKLIDSPIKLDELGDFAPTETVQELVPKVDYSTPIEN